MPISQIVTNSIADSAVVTVDIANGAVTAAKMAASSVNLASSTVTGQLPLATGVSGTLPRASLPTGSVLQVVQVTKTNTFSTNSQSFVDVTGLSVSITPISASNKILVCASINASGDQHSDIRLVRDSTPIAIGDASGSQIQSTFHFYMGFSGSGGGYNIYNLAMMWLDSPATTSSVTYKAQASNNWTSAYTTLINRTFQDQDAGYNGRTPSTITLMEIAA